MSSIARLHVAQPVASAAENVDGSDWPLDSVPGVDSRRREASANAINAVCGSVSMGVNIEHITKIGV